VNALMECAVSGTDIDARFESLQKELLALIG
jgi:raffinose/stachyose/melibiose transport system substrate-binding protein